ncbi:MarR family transcriptional regulator [Streptomyces chrestomyceticus]|uniref:MarR family transcriptional regulator n=1 Tax=Streptomyces chrestomyceticus TaxID=68185 RepID=UPI000F623A9F|nr:MarR family transcriptional regulator [Streptomyces chrestomyceticus]
MADAKLTTAPCAPVPPHPEAATGYGKRSAPDQARSRPGDFAHLPEREAYLGAFIDRLPDGAAMDVKTLAAAQPRYGQQAVRSALTRLSTAGHLRRVQETVGNGRSQWVYRTYFTRTARDDAWWHHFLTAGAPSPTPAPASAQPSPEPPPPSPPEPSPPPSSPPPPPPPLPQVQPDERPLPSRRAVPASPVPAPPAPSPAYAALAALGTADPRMILSAAECAALEDLAAEWLARGVSSAHLVTVLTAGLPPEVYSAGAIARRRLTDKLPPAPPLPPPDAATPTPTRILECTECGVPGRPEALPGGLCRPCRGDSPPPAPDADHLRAERTRHFAHLARSFSRPRSTRDTTQRVGSGRNP